MDMNTMNLVPTLSTKNTTVDLTTLASLDLEAWFADVGMAVTEVRHCESAACPVCFPQKAAAERVQPARAA
jgi:hypothetical protein